MSDLTDLERTLRDRLDAIGPAPRAVLLQVLMMPDHERAGRIGELYGDSRPRRVTAVARQTRAMMTTRTKTWIGVAVWVAVGIALAVWAGEWVVLLVYPMFFLWPLMVWIARNTKDAPALYKDDPPFHPWDKKR
jgi:hypothetical protein